MGWALNVFLYKCSKYFGAKSTKLSNSPSLTYLIRNNSSLDLNIYEPDLPPDELKEAQLARDLMN